jgi:predicted small metal-binding protein
MAKEVTCSTDSFRVRADTDDELVTHVQQHNKMTHNRDVTREQVLDLAKTVPEAATVV